MPDTKAKKDWDRTNTTKIGIKFNNRTDADIIAKLAEQENKAGYIKHLIRQDIAKSSPND